MLLIKNKKIENPVYNLLITYLHNCCDVATFSLCDFHEGFDAYESRMEELFAASSLNKFIIRKYWDSEYCNSVSGYSYEIYVVSLSKETIRFFMLGLGLYNWLFPYLPEDLCFYRNGKCFLESISHERICRIYSDDEHIKAMLRKIGLNFFELPDEEPPTLKYTLMY